MRARRPRGRQPASRVASKRLGTVSIRSERAPPAGRCANRYSRCGFLTRRWPILFGADESQLSHAQCARWATCSCSRPSCTPGIPETACTVEKGHGRLETRRIATSREVVPHLDWPGVAQVGRIEREREIRGQTSREVAYAVTSLTREQAGPEALLSLVRGHWAIENQLHWRRDVSLREDACRVRSGCAPQALAALRNTVLRLARALPGPAPGRSRDPGREPSRCHPPRHPRLSLNGPAASPTASPA